MKEIATFENVLLIEDINKYQHWFIDHIIDVSINKLLWGQVQKDKKYSEVSNASHYIENIKIIENKMYGDVKLLKTINGEILRELSEIIDITKYIVITETLGMQAVFNFKLPEEIKLN